MKAIIRKFGPTRLLAILVTSFAMVLGMVAIAPTAHAGAMCDGYWKTGGSTWSKACYFQGGSNSDYGQVVDTKTDGYCVDVKYNRNDGTGWHHVTNSTACTTGAIVSFYAYHLTTGWWMRVYRANGSYWTLIDCFHGGGAIPCVGVG